MISRLHDCPDSGIGKPAEANSLKRLLQFSFTAVAILLVAASINYFIDPFGYFGINRIGYFMDSERELKSGVIGSKSFDGIILGSSKVTYFNPDHFTEFKIFNAGFGAALPEEILYLLQDTTPQTNFLLLGLDLFMFNEKTFPFVNADKFPQHNIRKRLSYLLSLDMLKFSSTALKNYQNGRRPKYQHNGARFSEDIAGNRDMKKHAELMHTLRTNHYHFSQGGLSGRRIQILQEINEWARRKNIRLIVWINPYHHEIMNLVANSDAGSRFFEFKEMAKAIFPDLIDLSGAFPEDNYYFQTDAYHYTSDTADLIYRQYLLPRIRVTSQQ